MGSIAKAINEASKATEYHVLRDYQKKTVEAYLSGRDVFASAPTRAGKSLTFGLTSSIPLRGLTYSTLKFMRSTCGKSTSSLVLEF